MVLFNTSDEQALPFQKTSASLLVRILAVPLLDGMADAILRSTLLAPDTRRDRPQIGLDLLRSFRTWDRRRMIDTVRSVLLDRASILNALADVSCPALIASGVKDAVAIIIRLYVLTPVWSTLIGGYVMNWPTPRLRVLTIVVELAGLFLMLGASGERQIPCGTGEWMALVAGVPWSLDTTGI